MASTLVLPALGALYAALAPWIEALLRAVVGLLLIPHGLRLWFGLFPNTGSPVKSYREFVDLLDQLGYRPGRFWGAMVVLTELVGGPLLALGLFTRPVCVPICILLVLSVHARKQFGWFWNKEGIEYPVLWAIAGFYFLINGGGAISLDRRLGWEF